MVKLVIRFSDLKDSNLCTPKKAKHKRKKAASKKVFRAELKAKKAKKEEMRLKRAKMFHDKENGALAHERKQLNLANALNGSTKPAPAAKPILPDFPLAGHEKS